jgi:hypothetical protein
VSFCVTGRSRVAGLDGNGRASSAVADQREEEGLDKARRGCRAGIDRGVDMNPW